MSDWISLEAERESLVANLELGKQQMAKAVRQVTLIEGAILQVDAMIMVRDQGKLAGESIEKCLRSFAPVEPPPEAV